MKKLTTTELEKVALLFDNWEETLIWSALEGIMGSVYATDDYESAIIVVGEFIFLAGKPSSNLFKEITNSRKMISAIIVPQSDEWTELAKEAFPFMLKQKTRYAIHKDPSSFNIVKIKELSEITPEGYEMQMMDENLYYKCLSLEWCKDFVSQFKDYQMYKKYGIGVIVTKDNEIVAGASSYTIYSKGIEIELQTSKEHRRKHLATAASARLILECLKKDLFPSWDAANIESLSIAENFGYKFSHEYNVLVFDKEKF